MTKEIQLYLMVTLTVRLIKILMSISELTPIICVSSIPNKKITTFSSVQHSLRE